ncbi:hypothetical protein J5N97_005807 [Dioscorea zingiberensis]|uniref:DNA-directed RNA polymerase I subunit rpa49 n=1 Tax=Dioscorea zingiberensis TaxID=325984 RepID=A0A9D5HT10_9LILI|nr:hypothetical protein J5N97_005807 [Dioscorea zingiberensis]
MEEEESRREPKSKKRKRLKVGMEVVSETPDRIPPLLGYFPSGYNPEGEAEQPEIKVLRNQRRTGRLELVVRPQGSNVQFVGRSYAGEATSPQLCTYALGVLDKESQSLKIIPIAANKVFRLEPRVVKRSSSEKDVGEVLAEESVGRKISELTNLYGTKKNRDKVSKWKLLNEQKNDHAATALLEGPKADDIVEEASEVKAVRNIPPHDISADTPEKAYLLDEIILPGERRHLMDILEMVQSDTAFGSSIKFWEENGYPSFVYNRIDKFSEIKDEDELKNLACIFSYITHLITFMNKTSKGRRFKSSHSSNSAALHNIPRVVHQKLTELFVDPESHVLSTEKRELLIGYILVLTLFADNFQTEPADIAKDLKIPYSELKPYYQQLGCKIVHDHTSRKSFQTLPVPLQFPQTRTYRKRRR